ncbi:MAG: four-carbon acid sugar kinase family protein [Leptolyngbyaceae bacterium]|nr:four-carbon acid sugar kinase family protein [Leptolyngbyaceae bacterium]
MSSPPPLPSATHLQPRPKIIVLDDDPTGSQTVHSCLLLLLWDVDTLRLGLRDDSPIFFVLTNTRSLPPSEAEAVTREVCRNLQEAIALESIHNFLIVSRSDSTLRGHYPLETDAIAQELGPFDAHFLVPAFLEGGRITCHSNHYVRIDGHDIPVHHTEFARDPLFAFHHSYLPDYVEEKTKGKILATAIARLQRSDLQAGCLDQLRQLQNNQCVVVDGEVQADLDCFATAILTAVSEGKRFLFRSAASLLTALVQLPPQPVSPEAMATLTRQGKPGVVLAGSYTAKTTRQLERLRQRPDVQGVEVDIAALMQTDDATALLEGAIAQINTLHQQGQGVVVYTSRQAITCEEAAQQLALSHRVTAFLNDIGRNLPETTGFLICKGGNTANTTLSHALTLQSVRLLGQLVPGCCIVRTAADHDRFPLLPVVMFPGNVGDEATLAIAYQRLTPQPFSSVFEQ